MLTQVCVIRGGNTRRDAARHRKKERRIKLIKCRDFHAIQRVLHSRAECAAALCEAAAGEGARKRVAGQGSPQRTDRRGGRVQIDQAVAIFIGIGVDACRGWRWRGGG